MKIIKKPKCVEGGAREYFILTCDFNSLEARCGAIDTVLNNAGLDPVLYDVYQDGSILDLHCTTGFATFCSSIHMKAIRVHDDIDNKDWVFSPVSKVKVLRGGKEEVVKSTELQISDHILDIG